MSCTLARIISGTTSNWILDSLKRAFLRVNGENDQKLHRVNEEVFEVFNSFRSEGNGIKYLLENKFLSDLKKTYYSSDFLKSRIIY